MPTIQFFEVKVGQRFWLTEGETRYSHSGPLTKVDQESGEALDGFRYRFNREDWVRVEGIQQNNQQKS